MGLEAATIAWIAAAVSVGSAYYASTLDTDQNSGVQLTKQGSQNSRNKVYGTAIVGSTFVYTNVWNKRSDTRLDVFSVGGVGPVHMRNVWIDDVRMFETDRTSSFVPSQTWKYRSFKAFGEDNMTEPYQQAGHFFMDWGGGTEDQEASTMAILFSDGEWTHRHKGALVPYVAILADYSTDPEYVIFGDRYDLKARVEAYPLYDPRTGAMDGPSNNPALALRDFLTSTYYGLGISPEYINDETVAHAADMCEIYGLEINSEIDASKPFSDTIEDILKCFSGALIIHEGKLEILFEDQEDFDLYEFNEDNILKGSFKLSPASTGSYYNAVSVTFKSAINKEKKDDYILPADVINDPRIISDGYLETKSFEMPFTIDARNGTVDGPVKWVANREYARANFQSTCSFDVDLLEFPLLKIWSVVNVSHDIYGLNKARYRVQSIKSSIDDERLNIATVNLVEYNDAIYEGTMEGVTGSPLPVIENDPVPAPINLNLSLESYTNEGYGVLSWERTAFTNSVTFDIEYKLTDVPNWTRRASQHRGNSFEFHGLKAKQYDFRVRTHDTIKGYSEWVYLNAQDITTPYTLPTVTGLSITSGSPDFIIKWDDMGSTVIDNGNADNPDAAGSNSIVADVFSHYEVVIRRGTTVRDTFRTTELEYVYKFDQNVASTDGLTRSINALVRIVDKAGNKSEAASFSFTNAQMPAPTNTRVINVSGTSLVEWDRATERDFAGTLVYVSNTAGFTPSADNLHSVISNESRYLYTFGEDTSDIYCRVAHFDVFGQDGLTYSQEVNLKHIPVTVEIDYDALNTATSTAEAARDVAQQAASDAELAQQTSEAAVVDANNAAASAQSAADSADASAAASLTSKNQAVNAANQAKTSATAAASAATDADGSATAALTAKTQAETAAGEATEQAEAAVVARTAADGSAQSALNAKTDAEAAANNADLSAQAAASAKTDADGSASAALVAKSDAVSAKNAAQTAASDAADSASAAATSAQAAATAQTGADGSAQAALTAKTEAVTASGNASDSADSAATSASNAAGSASSASSSASKAATSATAAATAATDAEGSAQAALTAKTDAEEAASAAVTAKTDAEGSASSALTARTQAQSSASSANTYKNQANTYKNQAATSASNAASSASAAAASADAASLDAQAAVQAKTDAEGYASAALVAKSDAEDAATSASTSAAAAAQSQADAEGNATASLTAQTKAEQAQSGAESARDAANTAKNQAVTAKNQAETAAEAAVVAQTSADGSATTALTAKSEAVSAKNAANTSKNQAATSASNAANSASQASNSASQASNSASQAANSASQATTQANVAVQAAADATEGASLVSQVSLVQGIIMDKWEGSVGFTQNSTMETGFNYTLRADMTGKAALRVKLWDAESGVRVAWNGEMLSPNPSGPDNAVVWYEYIVDANEGDNTVSIWAVNTDGGAIRAIELRGGDQDEKFSAVEERLNATEDEAYYSLKVQSDGKVAGWGATASPAGTNITFQADQIGFTNSAGSGIFPFTVRDDIVYMDKTRVVTLEANTIVNVESVENTEKRAQLGNTLVEGSFTLMTPEQIEWKDLDSDFRDRLVLRSKDAVATGGTYAASGVVTSSGTLYAAKDGNATNPSFMSGGKYTQITVKITGGQGMGEPSTTPLYAPSATYTLYRKNVTDGTTENLGSRTVTGNDWTEDSIPKTYHSSINSTVIVTPPLPTNGKTYEYWLKFTAKSGSWGSSGGRVTIEVNEEVSSTDSLVVNTEWDLIKNKPSQATRWPTWSEVYGQTGSKLDYDKVRNDHFLTTKGNSVGNFSTNGSLITGRGSGGVALTINDGKGNANVTFNHAYGVPEQNGNAARIEVNTDSTSDAHFSFEVSSNVTKGQEVNLTQLMKLSGSVIQYKGYDVYHKGNKPSKSDVGLNYVQNRAFNWSYGTSTPTQIWGGQGDGINQYIYTPNDVRDAMDIRWSDIQSKPQIALSGPKDASTLGNANLAAGIYDISNTEAPTIGLAGDWYHVINMEHRNNNGYGAQIAVRFQGANPEMRLRSAEATDFGEWATVYHTAHKPTYSELGVISHGNTDFANQYLNTVSSPTFSSLTLNGSLSVYGNFINFVSGTDARIQVTDANPDDTGAEYIFWGDGVSGNAKLIAEVFQGRLKGKADNAIQADNATQATSANQADKVTSMGNVVTMPMNREIISRGLFTYSTNNNTTNPPHTSNYGESLVWGDGTGGSIELWGGWTSGGWGRLYTRALRDTIDNWSEWYEVYTSREPRLRAVLKNGYEGLMTTNGSDVNWIRTTANGILPYQSGGDSALGTSSWPFQQAHIQTINAYASANLARTTVTASGTIGGNISNFGNAWLTVGDSNDGWAIDPNEMYSAKEGHIGTFAGDLNLKPADALCIKDGVRLTNAGGDTLQVMNGSGYVRIGAANTSYAHFYTDRPNFYMDKGLYVNGPIAVYGKLSKFTSDGNYAMVGATSAAYIRMQFNGDIERINTSWTNNPELRKIVRNGYLTNIGDYMRLQPSGNRTTNGSLVIGTNTFAVGLDDYEDMDTSLSAPLNDTWMAVTTDMMYLSGKEAFRHNDTWLRINQTGAFSAGVYFGSSVVRTDGSLRVGSNGSSFSASMSQIDLKSPTRVHDKLFLKEVVSQDGNYTTIGAGEVGSLLYEHAGAKFGAGHEGVHLGGETGVFAWSSPDNLSTGAGGMYYVRLITTEGSTLLNYLDVSRTQGSAGQPVARFRHPTLNATIGIMGQDNPDGAFRIEANASGDLRIQTATLDGSYDNTNGVGSIARFHRNGDVWLTGYGYARSHGAGTLMSPIMTHGDFLAPTPPAGLEDVITANWIGAGAIQARHLQVNGGTKAAAGEKRSFKISPDDPRPLHFALLNDDLTVKEDIFYVEKSGDAFFAGKLSKDTVDINSIQEEARKQINPHYLGTVSGGSQSKSNVTLSSGQGVALTAINTIGGKVNIKFRLSASLHYYGDTNQNYIAPDWTVELRRDSASGTVLFSKRYQGNANNWYESEYGGGQLWESTSTLTIDESFTDSSAPSSEVYYLRVVRHGGSPTTMKVHTFSGESPSFRTNQLKSSGTMDVFWDKETGYMVTTGYHWVNEDTALSITFPYAYSEVHSAVISGAANIDSTSDSHNSYVSALNTSYIKITNGDEYSSGKYFYWQVTGKRTSSI